MQLFDNLFCKTAKVLLILCYFCSSHLLSQAEWIHPPFTVSPLSDCGENCIKCGGIFGDICITCEPSYYLTSYGTCSPCNNICSSCTGPLETQCLTCKSELFLFIDGRCEANTRHLQVNNNIVLPTANVILTSGYILYYKFNNDPANTVDLYFVYNNNNWFGIGFGTTMKNTDMIIIEYINGVIVVTDRYSTGNVVPSLDTVLSGTSDLTLVEYSVNSTSTVVHINRKQNTGDAYDFTLNGLGKYNIMWAYSPSSTIQYHGYNGQKNIVIANFDNTLNSIAEPYTINNENYSLYAAHGIIQFILWGLAAEVAAYFPLIFRHAKRYYFVHTILWWIIFITHWACHIVMFVDLTNRGVKISEASSLYKAHFAIGITVLIINTFQMLGGTIVLKKLLNYNGNQDYLKHKKIHRNIGITLLLLSKVNLVIGVKVAQSKQVIVDNTAFALMLIFVILLVLARVFIMMMYRVIKKREPTRFPPSDPFLTLEQEALIAQINKGLAICDIKENFPNIKWVLMGNKIIDITKFVHPGGNFILKEVLGRDINRFIYGSFGLENDKDALTRYQHSYFAMNLMNAMVIGYINQKCFMEPFHDRQCSLFKYQVISPTISRFVFQCPNIEIRSHFAGLSWIGSYYRLCSMVNPSKKRYYAAVFCMTDNNIEFRNALIKYYEDYLAGNTDPVFILPKDIKESNNLVPLIIKKYNGKGALSKYIHDIQGSNIPKFALEGPFGREIGIRNITKGRQIIFAVGTGIIRFLDLLHYMLITSIFRDLRARGIDPKKLNELNVFQEEYEKTFDETFSVELYLSYPNEKEMLGFEIVKQLSELNHNNKKFFSAIVRNYKGDYVETYNGRFDKDLVEKITSTPFDNILVCGTALIYKILLSTCTELGCVNKLLIL